MTADLSLDAHALVVASLTLVHEARSGPSSLPAGELIEVLRGVDSELLRMALVASTSAVIQLLEQNDLGPDAIADWIRRFGANVEARRDG